MTYCIFICLNLSEEPCTEWVKFIWGSISVVMTIGWGFVGVGTCLTGDFKELLDANPTVFYNPYAIACTMIILRLLLIAIVCCGVCFAF